MVYSISFPGKLTIVDLGISIIVAVICYLYWIAENDNRQEDEMVKYETETPQPHRSPRMQGQIF